jgi:hypothetical protein
MNSTKLRFFSSCIFLVQLSMANHISINISVSFALCSHNWHIAVTYINLDKIVPIILQNKLFIKYFRINKIQIIAQK